VLLGLLGLLAKLGLPELLVLQAKLAPLVLQVKLALPELPALPV
jgi:hypothetical protein